MKVSVIIPVYNAQKYLRECLDSLQAQTMKDAEFICVDDGSTDDSLKILREYQEKDSRFRLMTQKNQYAGVARNNGMKEAKGEYLLFLDADDFFVDTLLEKVYERGCEKDADVVLFGAKQFHQKEEKVIDSIWYLRREMIPEEEPFSIDTPGTHLLDMTAPHPWTKAFKREFVEREGLQFQALPYSNDVYFVLTALCIAKRIACVQEDFVYYRMGLENNLQSKKHKDPLCFMKAYQAVYGELQKRGFTEKAMQEFLNRYLAGCVHNLQTARDQETRWKICANMDQSEFRETGMLDKPEDYFMRPEDLAYVKGMKKAREWSLGSSTEFLELNRDFTDILDRLKEMSQCSLSEEEENLLENEFDNQLAAYRKMYHTLPLEDKWFFEGMDYRERAYFRKLVKEYDDELCRREDLKVRYEMVCEDKRTRGMEIHELRRQKQERGEQIRSLEQEARKDQSRIKELQNQVKGLQKRVTDLENSRSYRLGKTLTAPVRWLHKES